MERTDRRAGSGRAPVGQEPERLSFALRPVEIGEGSFQVVDHLLDEARPNRKALDTCRSTPKWDDRPRANPLPSENAAASEGALPDEPRESAPLAETARCVIDGVVEARELGRLWQFKQI